MASYISPSCPLDGFLAITHRMHTKNSSDPFLISKSSEKGNELWEVSEKVCLEISKSLKEWIDKISITQNALRDLLKPQFHVCIDLIKNLPKMDKNMNEADYFHISKVIIALVALDCLLDSWPQNVFNDVFFCEKSEEINEEGKIKERKGTEVSANGVAVISLFKLEFNAKDPKKHILCITVINKAGIVLQRLFQKNDKLNNSILNKISEVLDYVKQRIGLFFKYNDVVDDKAGVDAAQQRKRGSALNFNFSAGGGGAGGGSGGGSFKHDTGTGNEENRRRRPSLSMTAPANTSGVTQTQFFGPSFISWRGNKTVEIAKIAKQRVEEYISMFEERVGRKPTQHEFKLPIHASLPTFDNRTFEPSEVIARQVFPLWNNNKNIADQAFYDIQDYNNIKRISEECRSSYEDFLSKSTGGTNQYLQVYKYIRLLQEQEVREQTEREKNARELAEKNRLAKLEKDPLFVQKKSSDAYHFDSDWENLKKAIDTQVSAELEKLDHFADPIKDNMAKKNSLRYSYAVLIYSIFSGIKIIKSRYMHFVKHLKMILSTLYELCRDSSEGFGQQIRFFSGKAIEAIFQEILYNKEKEKALIEADVRFILIENLRMSLLIADQFLAWTSEKSPKIMVLKSEAQRAAERANNIMGGLIIVEAILKCDMMALFYDYETQTIPKLDRWSEEINGKIRELRSNDRAGADSFGMKLQTATVDYINNVKKFIFVSVNEQISYIIKEIFDLLRTGNPATTDVIRLKIFTMLPTLASSFNKNFVNEIFYKYSYNMDEDQDQDAKETTYVSVTFNHMIESIENVFIPLQNYSSLQLASQALSVRPSVEQLIKVLRSMREMLEIKNLYNIDCFPTIIAPLYDKIKEFFCRYSSLSCLSDRNKRDILENLLSCLGALVCCSAVEANKNITNDFVDYIFNGGFTPEAVQSLEIVLSKLEKNGNKLHPVHIYARECMDRFIVRNFEQYKVKFTKEVENSSRRQEVADTGSKNSTIFAFLGGKGNPATEKQTSNLEKEDVSVSSRVALLFSFQVLISEKLYPKLSRESDNPIRRVDIIDSERQDDSDTNNISPDISVLNILADKVIHYFSDYRDSIRKSAANTCILTLDMIVNNCVVSSDILQTNSKNKIILIIDHLLFLCKFDESLSIRVDILNSFISLVSQSLDKYVSLSNNLHFIIQALYDESIDIRSRAMTIIARVSPFDPLHIMPEIRVQLNYLLKQLQSSIQSDSHIKSESVKLLQIVVRGCNELIVPYASQIVEVALKLIGDPSSEIVDITLETVGNLGVAYPDIVSKYLDTLFPKLISALIDENSRIKKSVAVTVLGKLVPVLTLTTVDKTYYQYSDLFLGLIRAIEFSNNKINKDGTLLLEAIRTIGLLGIVSYEEHNKFIKKSRQDDIKNIGEIYDEKFEDLEWKLNDSLEIEGKKREKTAVSVNAQDAEGNQRKKSPAIDKEKTDVLYFNNIMRQLIIMLRDDTWNSNFQLEACDTGIRILRLKLSSIPLHGFAPFLDAMLYKLDIWERELEFKKKDLIKDLVKRIALLIEEMGPFFRLIRNPREEKFMHIIVRVISNNISSNFSSICKVLILSLHSALPAADFHYCLQEVLPKVFEFFRLRNETRSTTQSDESKFALEFLEVITKVVSKVGDFRLPLLSFTSSILMDKSDHINVRVSALYCMLQLSLYCDDQIMANIVILPLIGLLPTDQDFQDNAQLYSYIFSAFSIILCRLSFKFLPFIAQIQKRITIYKDKDKDKDNKYLKEFEILLVTMFKQKPFPESTVCAKCGVAKVNNIAALEVRACEDTYPPHDFVDAQVYYPSAFSIFFGLLLVEEKVEIEPIVERTAETVAETKENEKDPENLLKKGTLITKFDKQTANEWKTSLVKDSKNPQFSNELIKACIPLVDKIYTERQQNKTKNATKDFPDALFNIAFHSFWVKGNFIDTANTIDSTKQVDIIKRIESTITSNDDNLVTSFLNMNEFMEMQNIPLPIDTKLLAETCAKRKMFANALRYREIEYSCKNLIPSADCIEALITINNELGIPDRAAGVLTDVKTSFNMIKIDPLWLEKLDQWDQAKIVYDDIIKLSDANSNSVDTKSLDTYKIYAGLLRCLEQLGEYERLLDLATSLRDNQDKHSLTKSVKMAGESVVDQGTFEEIRRLGANAAWSLGKWDKMQEFVDYKTTSQHPNQTASIDFQDQLSYFKTILAINKKDFEKATELIKDSRLKISKDIDSSKLESYARAKVVLLPLQILSELEEVIEYKLAEQQVLIASVPISTSILEPSGSKLQRLTRSPSGTNMSSTRRSFRGQKGQNYSNKNFGDYDFGDNNKDDVDNRPHIDLDAKKSDLLKKWRGRMEWAPRDASIFRQILAVHTLVALNPMEDLDNWLDLVEISRKDGKFTLCKNILKRLGARVDHFDNTPANLDEQFSSVADAMSPPSPTNAPSNVNQVDLERNFRVKYHTFLYWWSSFEEKTTNIERNYTKADILSELTGFLEKELSMKNIESMQFAAVSLKRLRVHCLLEHADWSREIKKSDALKIAKDDLDNALDLDPNNYRVWHTWAAVNQELLAVENKKTKVGSQSTGKISRNQQKKSISKDQKYEKDELKLALVSIQAFVRSIELGRNQPSSYVLQDILRLLSLWFKYGNNLCNNNYYIMKNPNELNELLDKVHPENFQSVLPQLISRINSEATSGEVTNQLLRQLTNVATAHPQSMVYPISIALNTKDNQQKKIAEEVLSNIRKSNSRLVKEAAMISGELMRVATSPNEQWLENFMDITSKIKEVNRNNLPVFKRYVTEKLVKNPILNPQVDFKASSNSDNTLLNGTLHSIAFLNFYGKSLNQALYFLNQFEKSQNLNDFDQAFAIYNEIKSSMEDSKLAFSKKPLFLNHMSMRLAEAVNLELTVPGLYRTDSTEIISIKRFESLIKIMASKQCPRKLYIIGSNGRRYPFLLKGREDLRQDERVMQLFSLVNILLSNDMKTESRSLSIITYSVLPLSIQTNVSGQTGGGLIGWVQNTDDVSTLIEQYRSNVGIDLFLEMNSMKKKSNFKYHMGDNRGDKKNPLTKETLTPMQKVDIFKQVTAETSGQDLSRVIWLKSKSAAVWVENRANFTKSMSVMSMVGYILGLGDRHMANMKIDRSNGRLVHIDLGDCFEQNINRDPYPEKVPFRLTRMLANVMERSGIEGTYKINCERVMSVLRNNRDSVIAILQAFLYDPMVNWTKKTKDDLNDMTDAKKLEAKVKSPKSPEDQKLKSEFGEFDKDDISNVQVRLFVGEAQKANSLDGGGNANFQAGAAAAEKIKTTGGGGDEEQAGAINKDEFNKMAWEKIQRVQNKLAGRDFSKFNVEDEESDELSVKEQVERLINDAISVEYLSKMFCGWKPYW